MARLNRNKNKLPVKPRTNWLLWVHTALIIGLYVLVLLEKLKWNG